MVVSKSGTIHSILLQFTYKDIGVILKKYSMLVCVKGFQYLKSTELDKSNYSKPLKDIPLLCFYGLLLLETNYCFKSLVQFVAIIYT